jgi:hypothetical protein
MADVTLPYPSQLPQDYYNKNLPPGAPPITPVEEPSIIEPITTPSGTQNFGGVWYGDTPPANPGNGWLWVTSKGALYVYMDPGVWSQIGTNW